MWTRCARPLNAGVGRTGGTLQSTLTSSIYADVGHALGSIQSDQRGDVYALSFFIYDDDDDPRRPSLTVGYNTKQRWQESIAGASSPDEAKWNYAFWLQNQLWATDRENWAERIEAWVGDLGFLYTDEEEDADFDRCMELGAKVTENFVSLACSVAAKLHETGAIVAVFGRPLPIIVHELEYYDQIADQTALANPPGLADEFVSWVRRGCP